MPVRLSPYLGSTKPSKELRIGARWIEVVALDEENEGVGTGRREILAEKQTLAWAGDREPFSDEMGQVLQ